MGSYPLQALERAHEPFPVHEHCETAAPMEPLIRLHEYCETALMEALSTARLLPVPVAGNSLFLHGLASVESREGN